MQRRVVKLYLSIPLRCTFVSVIYRLSTDCCWQEHLYRTTCWSSCHSWTSSCPPCSPAALHISPKCSLRYRLHTLLLIIILYLPSFKNVSKYYSIFMDTAIIVYKILSLSSHLLGFRGHQRKKAVFTRQELHRLDLSWSHSFWDESRVR